MSATLDTGKVWITKWETTLIMMNELVGVPERVSDGGIKKSPVNLSVIFSFLMYIVNIISDCFNKWFGKIFCL